MPHPRACLPALLLAVHHGAADLHITSFSILVTDPTPE